MGGCWLRIPLRSYRPKVHLLSLRVSNERTGLRSALATNAFTETALGLRPLSGR